MNRFRIDLGFLPQHLPQQINFVTWKGEGSSRAESEPWNHAVGHATASQTLADLGQWGDDL